MSKLFDLSGPLYEGMWSYSSLLDLKDGLPEFECKRLAAVEADGFEAFGYRLSSITGTYIETGAHMLAGAPMLNDLDASAFIRPAVVCHVPRKGPGEVIHGAELGGQLPAGAARRCAADRVRLGQPMGRGGLRDRQSGVSR